MIIASLALRKGNGQDKRQAYEQQDIPELLHFTPPSRPTERAF
jgi:hypothetical protein